MDEPSGLRARIGKWTIAAALGLLGSMSTAASAQSAAAFAPPPPVQTQADAIAQDAREYANRHQVSLYEGIRRVRAQEESAAATDRLRELHRGRLAGISIEHSPDYRILVLLTGEDPVPDQAVVAGGMTVPIVFRTGAQSTQDEIVAAMIEHRDALRGAVRKSQGMGLDQRTGELVLLVRAGEVDADERAVLDAELERLTGVAVRIDALNGASRDFAIGGGSRVEGVDPQDGRRYACTTGFVVTDGAQTGLVTAAHCPDELTYFSPDGVQVPLSFVGGWGARYQDVQVHVASEMLKPQFYPDTAKSVLRPVEGWRGRTSTRAGEVVCHRGETTGYSCSEVDLTDFAPPGELCAGPCDPVWVSVAGPSCRGGDSGGPVFNGTMAYGITKGGSYSPTGQCNFYYYMSADFIPEGWALLTTRGSAPASAGAPSANLLRQ